MMEAAKVINVQGKPDLWLPPGFRFHPTDDELISFYLTGKVRNSNFAAHAITEVDLNKYEPWDLPERANLGEKEWYFFTLRDRKYPTGMRTNRATVAGYWKATGKDRDVISSRTSLLVGMKKTLVFYRGRAPRGEKTNWIMHEYRLEGKAGALNSLKTTKEWVVCRVFQKKTGAKKQIAVQRNKDASYSGASDPPSPFATRQSPLMGVESTDDEDWCNNDQVSCVTKQHESEELENKRCLPGNNCSCKIKSTSFPCTNEDHPSSIGSFLKKVSGEEIGGNGNMYSTGKFSSSGQEFMPPLCSPAPYSSNIMTASKHVLDNYTFTNSNLIKSCKLEPYSNPGDHYFPSSKMTEILNSWMGGTVGYDNVGVRPPPPLQLPPPIESGLESDSHTDDIPLNLHRFIRYHPDQSLGMIELQQLYQL